jgi:hypothetical protein
MSSTFARLAGGLRGLRPHLRAAFTLAESEPADYPFVASDVAQLQRVAPREGQPPLDEQTWNDLLLEPYMARLSQGVSIFGRQELYRRLRAGFDDGGQAALRGRVLELMEDPQGLLDLRQALKSLRYADAEVAALLFEESCPPIPRWAGRTWPLPLGLLASIAAVALSPLAWLGVALTVYLLISVQVKYYERVQAWNRRANSLQLLLRTDSLLADDPTVAARGFTHDAGARAGRINRGLSRSVVLAAVPGAQEYADWFKLSNVNRYFRGLQAVFAERAFLRDCLLRVAQLEADAALARHLLESPQWCWARRGERTTLRMEHVVHPLVPSPAPLSIALHGKGAFISGQNGVGKSTFMRTLGLNLVTARGFGFCYAASAQVPMLPVYASMQNEDSLAGGESLYMAELRRARELVDSAGGPHAGIYLVDEIFRGTNHLESVASGAAVVDTLAQGGLVMVASHNLELASLLAHRLDPYCVVRDGAGTGLRLRPGVLAETNGIALLSKQGFAPEVQQKAGRVARWLERYLAEPDAGKAVLGEPSGA